MRLESFGVTDYTILDDCGSDTYKLECVKSLKHIEKLIYQEQVETYEEDRKTAYFEPKSKIELREAVGRPLVADCIKSFAIWILAAIDPFPCSIILMLLR